MPGRRRLLVLAAAAGAMSVAGTALADDDLGTVDGRTYIRDSVTVPAAPATGNVDAACPGKTSVIGGGTTGGNDPMPSFYVNSAYPFDGDDADRTPDDGWRGRIVNRNGGSKGFTVTAICTIESVSYGKGVKLIKPHRAGALRVDCSEDAYVAGGGARLGGPASPPFLNSSHPFDDGDENAEPDNGWRARAFNGSSKRVKLRVYAACVAFQPTYVEVDSSAAGLVFTDCPSGFHAVAGGPEADGQANGSHISVANPFADPTNPPDAGYVVATGARGGGDGPGFTAHLVCLD
jgi:hypothetical protein